MPAQVPQSYSVIPDPSSVTVNVANIMFTGSGSDYNPLFDRKRQLNIEPPQLQKNSGKNEPISYVRNKKVTVKLDITGSPDIPPGASIWVRVTPTAELLKKTVTKDGKEEPVPDPGVLPLKFTPASKTIQVSNWSDPDYEKLTFTTTDLPNEVRLNQLKITWKFEYRYTETGSWYNAGEEMTCHEIYITYCPSYKGFLASPRPWKEVLKRACSYAHGATSMPEVSTLVAIGIYDSREFFYDGERSHSEFNNAEIRLWEMMTDGWVDCRDGSNYYTIMMRWLGIPANQIKINEDPRRDQGFYYKTLRPISVRADLDADWSVRNLNNRSSNWWNFHQVGTLDRQIYDAIIRIDRPRTKRVPTDMARNDYKDAIFDPVPDPRTGRTGQFIWDVEALVRKVV